MNMKKYYQSLSHEQKLELADACNTSVVYLSQIANSHRRAGIKTIIAIEKATEGQVTGADLRPDLYN